MNDVNITISPVIGGFVVRYPKHTPADRADFQYQTEVATSVGKAMRIAKEAVQAFSLVVKEKSEDSTET